jgi:hypothetical protein
MTSHGAEGGAGRKMKRSAVRAAIIANALLVKIRPDGRSGRYRSRYACGCMSSVVLWAQRFRQTGSVGAKWVAMAIHVSRTSETGCSLGSLRRLICRFKTSGASLPRAMSTPAMARCGAFSPRRRSPLEKIVSAAEQDRPDHRGRADVLAAGAGWTTSKDWRMKTRHASG